MEHWRGLGVVGQREFVDQRRMTQDQLQIEFDAGLPGRIERQPERLRARGDQRIDGVRLRRRRSARLGAARLGA